MARAEQDREDILREATALSPRAELRSQDLAENLVFGFRSTGGLSLFFGADPVYQFNSAGKLRRAYVGGFLYKAVKGRLQRLHRERQANQVNLWQAELSIDEQDRFLAELNSLCVILVAMIDAGKFELVNEIPAESDSVARLKGYLADLASPPQVADRPNAG